MIHFKNVEGKPLEDIRNGAYYRCFGNIELAKLLSRVQSLIVKYGYELENVITDSTENNHIEDLDVFFSEQIISTGIYLATKKVIKKSKVIQGDGIEPDFMVFERVGSEQNCYIIELKDGHEFDTKSSAKESANLSQFIEKNTETLQFYRVYSKIVGFNAATQDEIRTGFKNKIELEQAMTGRAFCELLELDYDQIVENRASDREASFDSIVNDFLSIPKVKEILASNI